MTPAFRLIHLLALTMLIGLFGCSGTDSQYESPQNGDAIEDGDSSTPSLDGDDALEPGAGFVPPMLSDPALLSDVFGPSMNSRNIDFGEAIEADFIEGRGWLAYTFDALPGARVTVATYADGERAPSLALYGPRLSNGLFGSHLAISSDHDNNGGALLTDYPIATGGLYLILVANHPAGAQHFTLALGCRNQCMEPPCPDLTCQGYCPGGLLRDPNGCASCACGGAPDEQTACADDSDCPMGESCMGGVCEMGGMGPCDCDGMDYDPVCGEDGITYANACEAGCIGMPIQSEGECPERPGAECSYDADCLPDEVCMGGQCLPAPSGCDCPAVVDPVCGADGRTYNNRCELDCAGAPFAHAGPCESVVDGACPPVCRMLQNGSPGWVDSCTDQELAEDDCMRCEAVCDFPDSDREGWYSSCSGELIAKADCLDRCGCPDIWEPICGADGTTYANQCEAECAQVPTAYAGECTPDYGGGCFADSDCPAGLICAISEGCAPEDVNSSPDCFGACEPPPNATLCQTDADCPLGEACVRVDGYGVCSEIEPSACRATGCFRELCAPQPLASVCEWRPEFACYTDAQCRLLPGGQCGWYDEGGAFETCQAAIMNGTSCAVENDCPSGWFCDRGVCAEAGCVCAPIQAPVCGMDGKTYTNACEMSCARTSLAYNGPC